jgi:hypothetical protein
MSNPVETDQALLHRKPRIWYLRSPIGYGAALLHRNMHIRKVLYELTLCAIAPRRTVVPTVSCTALVATEPTNNRRSPPMPRVPMAICTAWSRRASRSIVAAIGPSAARVSRATGDCRQIAIETYFDDNDERIGFVAGERGSVSDRPAGQHRAVDQHENAYRRI